MRVSGALPQRASARACASIGAHRLHAVGFDDPISALIQHPCPSARHQSRLRLLLGSEMPFVCHLIDLRPKSAPESIAISSAAKSLKQDHARTLATHKSSGDASGAAHGLRRELAAAKTR